MPFRRAIHSIALTLAILGSQAANAAPAPSAAPAAPAAPAQASAAPAPAAGAYRILVVNDDGINAAGIAAVAAELAKQAEVVICAPAENQSGASQSAITSYQETTVRKVMKDGKLFGYSITGRPADATRYGLEVLGREKPFNLVVSGINHGANSGNVAHGSGTVGAAMEAVGRGVPGIAVSQNGGPYTMEGLAVASRFTAQLVSQVRKHGAPKEIVLNVNVPPRNIKGVKIAPMGASYLRFGGFRETATNGDETTYASAGFGMNPVNREEFNDTTAMQDGYIAVAALRYNWNDAETQKALEAWDLKIDLPAPAATPARPAGAPAAAAE